MCAAAPLADGPEVPDPVAPGPDRRGVGEAELPVELHRADEPSFFVQRPPSLAAAVVDLLAAFRDPGPEADRDPPQRPEVRLDPVLGYPPSQLIGSGRQAIDHLDLDLVGTFGEDEDQVVIGRAGGEEHFEARRRHLVPGLGLRRRGRRKQCDAEGENSNRSLEPTPTGRASHHSRVTPSQRLRDLSVSPPPLDRRRRFTAEPNGYWDARPVPSAAPSDSAAAPPPPAHATIRSRGRDRRRRRSARPRWPHTGACRRRRGPWRTRASPTSPAPLPFPLRGRGR